MAPFERCKIENAQFLLYVHCLSGKDRTGVVIVVFLKMLGIPRKCIVQEYLLSEGHVSGHLIGTALDGIALVDSTFSRVDLEQVRFQLLFA